LCVLILAACGGGGSTPAPYALVAFDHRGDFYSINPADGTVDLIHDTYYQLLPSDPKLELKQVSSCLYNTLTGEIWMGPGGLGASVCGGCIYRLDMKTGEAIRLADSGADGLDAVPGMAMGPFGRIFAPQYAHGQEGDGGGLFQIDNVSGSASIANGLWPIAIGNGMTFDGQGVLFVAGDEKLYFVNPEDVAVELGRQVRTGFPFPEGTRGDIISMATRPTDGKIFCIFKEGAGRGGGGGSGGVTHLATVDTATLTVTHVVRLPLVMDGLAIVPTDVLSR